MNENEKLKNQSNGRCRKYIVMDIVFYGSSLNYDQGAGNYQELKKITKWDGKQYVLVSRYALRYSILHWANKLFPDKWRLAGNDVLIAEKGDVARIKSPEEVKKEYSQKYSDFMKNIFLNYPEFDLFGFMSASSEQGQKGISITRTSPVKISHAVSLTPYNYDSQFTANLDVMKRAAGPGAGSNPVTIEEKKDFYIYNIVIDVDRIGKYLKEEHGGLKDKGGNETIGDIDVRDKRNDRIKELVETIFNLKREIKGRMEDLSPWLVICGLYNDGKYETYLDKIELAKSNVYKVITKEKDTKDGEGRTIKEIEHEIIEKDAPKFVIDINANLPKLVTKEQIINKLETFLKNESITPEILIYKRSLIQTEPTFLELK